MRLLLVRVWLQALAWTVGHWVCRAWAGTSGGGGGGGLRHARPQCSLQLQSAVQFPEKLENGWPGTLCHALCVFMCVCMRVLLLLLLLLLLLWCT